MGLITILRLLIVLSTSFQVQAQSFSREEPRRRIFGELLKPPPPPQGFMRRPPWNSNRVQRQNFDMGYQYPPLAPPPPQLATNFRLPSPFSKPFNGYSYVPPPQPFFTTPSPGLFQKVSDWLFPGNQNQVSPSTSPFKKDCNPCNMFPWIPVIRYNVQQVDNPTYGPPSQIYPNPSQVYGPPNYVPAPPISTPTPFYGTQTPSFTTQINTYIPPSSTPPTQSTDVDVFNPDLPPPANKIQLPKVSIPTGFKNSYGEDIISPYALDPILPVPATAAESSKLKAEIVAPDGGPFNPFKNNSLVKVPSPSPFSTHKGRGIHTLQPVALPNLSASPIPPIFNARPFRLTSNSIVNKYINHQDGDSKDVDVIKSVPLAEFTSSVEYPIKYIQSPLVDIEVNSQKYNKTKSYRTGPNANFDASSQASESQTSSILNESSFEGTGTGTGTENQIFQKLPPNYFEIVRIPNNDNDNKSSQKTASSGLRGFAYDNDQDLQAVDSPILYLKPSAPHKDFATFTKSLPSSTTEAPNDFEIYDDSAFTSTPSTTEPWKAITFTDFTSDLQPPPPYPEDTTQKPKLVQIIIPYTTGETQSPNYSGFQEWVPATEDFENLARKVPSFSDLLPSTSPNDFTESTTPYSTSSKYDEEPITEAYEILRLNTPRNDLYDVKEPPFDIISLQHNIDGWTEQEFGSYFKKPQKDILPGKLAHAKKIPDDFFTTAGPQTAYQTTEDFRSFYDHEFASSMYHSNKQSVESSSVALKPNSIEQQNDKKGKDLKMKNFIYTAASSFRNQSPTTVPPWGKIETSISPLTKEKVYVVTAQPWRENTTVIPEVTDNSVSGSEFAFKSPRFSSRPSPLPSGKDNSQDESHPFGKAWHQSINNLEECRNDTRRSSHNVTLVAVPSGMDEPVQNK